MHRLFILALITAIGCIDPASAPTESQSTSDLTRQTGMSSVPWPANPAAWPGGSPVSVFVVLHHGYDVGGDCVNGVCNALPITHAFVVGVYGTGTASVSQICAFDADVTDRFVAQINTTFPEYSRPGASLNYSVQGAINGPPVAPHGPGGDEYSAADLAYIQTAIANQYTAQIAISEHAF